jgi:hypothetical protein
VTYYARYFADGVVGLKAIAAGLVRYDPAFKIDSGELLRGGELLGELEICAAGSDLFGEDLAAHLGQVSQVGSPVAHQVAARLQRTQSIVTLRIIDGERDPAVTWEMIGPLWSVLPELSTGLSQFDGQGFYDGAQLVLSVG